jgi:Fe-S cluster biogenesis protein NfuA
MNTIDLLAVRDAINRIRPYLQREGSDIELVGVDDTRAYVRLIGTCAACPGDSMILQLGVERWLRDEVPGLKGVVLA